MTIDINIRIDTTEKEKHGNVFPELRAAPGEDMGQADDQRLNSMFGTDNDSFFNTTTNDAISVALSMMSGTEHYNLDLENDMITFGEVNSLISSLNQQIRDLDKANPTSAEVELRNQLIQKKSKIMQNINLADETYGELNQNDLTEDDNYNPDFSQNSIAWRYKKESFDANNKAGRQDNITISSKYPNLNYPMNIINQDSGSLNYDKDTAYPADIRANGNSLWGSNQPTNQNKVNSDLYNLIRKYKQTI